MNTQSNKTGWEGSCKVNGLEPKLGFREAIIGCMADNGYIEKEEQMQAIDDWHYRVESEMRLWKNKEAFLADKFNAALKAAGWNVVVKVQFAPKDDDSFIIDLSDHCFPPYYMMLCYDGLYGTFEQDVDVTRDKNQFYLRLISLILNNTEDTEERIKQITEMLEGLEMVTDERNGDEYSIVDIRPQLLLKNGMVAAEFGILGSDELLYPEFPDRNDYEDEDEYDDAREEFEADLHDEGLSEYYLKII